MKRTHFDDTFDRLDGNPFARWCFYLACAATMILGLLCAIGVLQ